MTKNNKIDPLAEAAVLELLANLFNAISIMDSGTIRQNIEISVDNTLPARYTSINKSIANYILDNFAFIYLGLVVNQEFRDTFKEAVAIEIVLDSKDNASKNQIRSEMKTNLHTASSSEYISINFSRYNEDIYKRLNGMISKSLEKITEYDDIFQDLCEELTRQDKIDIGFCASNFMFLLRALNNNTIFFDYIKSVIEHFKATLNIKI